jgi:hypothetical protein
MVYIDQRYGNRTVPFKNSPRDRAKRIAGQIGALLDSIRLLGMTGPDMEITRLVLQKIYVDMGWRFSGCLSNLPYTDETGKVLFAKQCLPSIQFNDFDPRIQDWLEFLMDNHDNSVVTIPWFDPCSEKCPYVQINSSVIWDIKRRDIRALEDLGYITTEKIYETIEFMTEQNKAKIRRIVRSAEKDMRQMGWIHCVRMIPEKFDFIFEWGSLYTDFMEVASEI